MQISLEKQKIKNNFEYALATYEDSAIVQRKIADQLLNKINNIAIPNGIVVDLGCGNCLNTQKLSAFINRSIIAVDLLEAQRLNISERISYINMDFDKITFNMDSLALAYSNMALQWSEKILSLFKKIYQALKSGGYFIFSIPLKETFKEIPSPHKNQFYHLNEIMTYLKKARFVNIEYQETQLVSRHDSPFEALRSIKATGANTKLTKSAKISSLRDMIRENKTELTYHIGLFIVKK